MMDVKDAIRQMALQGNLHPEDIARAQKITNRRSASDLVRNDPLSKKLHPLTLLAVRDLEETKAREREAARAAMEVPYGQTLEADLPHPDPAQELVNRYAAALQAPKSNAQREFESGTRSVGDSPLGAVAADPLRYVRDVGMTVGSWLNPTEWVGAPGFRDVLQALREREERSMTPQQQGVAAGRRGMIDAVDLGASVAMAPALLSLLGRGAANLGTRGLRAAHQRFNGPTALPQLEGPALNDALSTYSGYTYDPEKIRRIAGASALGGAAALGYSPDVEAAPPKALLSKSLSNPAWLKAEIAGKHMLSAPQQQERLDALMRRVLDMERTSSGVDPEQAFALRRSVQRLPTQDPAPSSPLEQLNFEEFAGGGSVKKAFRAALPALFGDWSPNVVKPKGGNWLAGSVESALKGLKRPEPAIDVGRNLTQEGANFIHQNFPGLADEYEAAFRASGKHSMYFARDYWPWLQENHPEVLEALASRKTPSAWINQWIEGPLTKYIKTRMASPEDEVRRLAEEGVLHVDHGALRQMSAHTGGAWAPEEWLEESRYWSPHSKILGNSPAARAWEDAADSQLDVKKAEHIDELSGFDYEAHPWAKPETLIVGWPQWTNNPERWVADDLGFSHLIDELSNALNPNSGLPAHLQLTPEAVKNMSMEKAVRRVADINAWRAAQKVEANRKLAEQASIVREYAENNPKGLRWVELKAPEVPEDELGITDRALLQDQLKYEGDTMGHCVGGYCDDVLSGKSRIFSLRDAKGEPHVTVETGPTGYVFSDIVNAVGSEKANEMLDRGLNLKGMAKEIGFVSNNDKIVQIKGKQNRKPNDEYLPFVQDFVKNPPHGQPWAEVGDLQNTGLRRTIDAFNSNELKKIQEAGIEVPTHVTSEELEAINRQIWPDPDVRAGAHPDGFASGGPIEKTSPWSVFSGHNSADWPEEL